MSRTVEKRIHLLEESARRLEDMAAFKGISEEAIIEQALDKLFCEHGPSPQFLADMELLRQLEAESGPSKGHIVPPIDTTKIIDIRPVYVNPALLRREE